MLALVFHIALEGTEAGRAIVNTAKLTNRAAYLGQELIFKGDLHTTGIGEANWSRRITQRDGSLIFSGANPYLLQR
jgi:hypothetical protein